MILLRRADGFTLLEMLVVMAIIALGTGLVVPRISGWIERAEARSWRNELLGLLREQPFKAYAVGQEQVLDAEKLRKALPLLPAEVQLRMVKPLRYFADGTTSGGELLLLIPREAAESWKIEAVTGAVVRPGTR